MLYLSLSVFAQQLRYILLESMSIDQFFEPILMAVLPDQFNDQISVIKGIQFG
jgi:hypothetical protein